MTKIILAGDVMLGRRISGIIKKDPTHPFKGIKDVLNADIVFGNLECPLSNSSESIKNKKYIFNADPVAIKGLKYAGFNILSLANNHIIDHKEQGIKDTIKALQEHNIAYIGLNKDIVMMKNIGFLAYCKPKNFFKKFKTKVNIISDDMIEDVKRAKQMVDFLVVSLHWGEEYSKQPSEEQIRLAHSLIDNGADIVAGHHSHRIQKIEKYKQGIIAYSLGNFVFDQIFSKNVKNGMVLKINTENMQYETIPTHINENYQVEIGKV